MKHTVSFFAAAATLIASLGCTSSELDPPLADARAGADLGSLDAGRGDGGPTPDASAQPDAGGLLDASMTGDAAPDARGIIYPDLSVGGDASDLPDADRIADAAPDAQPPPGDLLDCAPLAAAGHEVCGATPAHCAIVFRDGSGCADACASAGLQCVASYRDDDDDPAAPRCAIHPTAEAFNCADTGHRSDGLRFTTTLANEERPDQVIGCERIFAHHAA